MAKRRGRLVLTGSILIGLLVVLALLPTPYDPAEQVDPRVSRYRPPGTQLFEIQLHVGQRRLADSVEVRGSSVLLRWPGGEDEIPVANVANLHDGRIEDHRFFLLGSDKFGRDVWSRVLMGARISLYIGFLAVIIAFTIGLTVGAAAAISPPWVDMVLMRSVDALLSFPQLFLIIALAAIFRPGTGFVVLLLGCTSWMGICRLARAEIISVSQRDFVLASRGLGQKPLGILLRHQLPNALTPLLVSAALLVGNLILAEAALSFFGLGVQAPTPSWGNMITEGREVLGDAWWVAFFPGLAIALTVIAFNLLGDGLRDGLDPRKRAHPSSRPFDSSGTEDLAISTSPDAAAPDLARLRRP